MIKKYKLFLEYFNVDKQLNPHFVLEEFKTLTSFKERLRYCKDTLKYIGAGSSRIVFQLDGKAVLKLARSKKGLEQNYNECNHIGKTYYESIISKVYDKAEEEEWIVSELARKTSKKEFKTFLGFDFDLYSKYLLYRIAEHNPQVYKGVSYEHLLTPKEIEFFNNDDFTEEMISFAFDFDIAQGDLGRINSYGVVNRDGDYKIVLVDYGCTN